MRIMNLIKNRTVLFFAIFVGMPVIFLGVYSDIYSRGFIFDYGIYFSGVLSIIGFVNYFFELVNIQLGEWVAWFCSLFSAGLLLFFISRLGVITQCRWVWLIFFLISLINAFVGRLVLVASFQ